MKSERITSTAEYPAEFFITRYGIDKHGNKYIQTLDEKAYLLDEYPHEPEDGSIEFQTKLTDIEWHNVLTGEDK